MLSNQSTGSSFPLADLWRFRELLASLIVRNLKLKFQRSVLGFLWTLANPLLTVLILTAVFTHVVRLPIADYWAFLISGYFVWHFASQAINTGTYVFFEHADLIRAVAFPTELLVLGAVLSRFFEFVVALIPVVLVIAVFHHQSVPASYLLLPYLALVLLLVVLGLTLPVAAASAFYYDVNHALPVALATLFYLSPIFYPASLVPERFASIYFLNPLAGVLTLFQVVLYDGLWPEVVLLSATSAYSVLVLLLGYAVFSRYKNVFAEVV